MRFLKNVCLRILRTGFVGRLPVRVRKGLAAGASWTLFPWTSYWRGAHEPDVQSCLMTLWDWKGKNVWDLGSHYGLYAVGLGRRVGPSGSVAAFEPNPLSFSRLQIHIKRNHLDWVKAFPLAVSDTPGARRFFAYDGLESTTTHLAYEGETWNAKIPTLTIEACRLDDLFKRTIIKGPDFIKVDVEGHAHKALAGGAQTIREFLPTLLCAFHSQNEVDGVRSLLDGLNYTYAPVQIGAPREPASGFDCIASPPRR